jgi:hypothetical protein
MAEHQGLPVAGYRPQNEENIRLVNDSKQLEEIVLRMLDSLQAREADVDQRWLAIGRSHIELGFMAINRSVFRPQRLE